MDINTIADDLRTEFADLLQRPRKDIGIVVTHRAHGRHTLEMHLDGKVMLHEFNEAQFRLTPEKFRATVLKPLLKQVG